uniref:Major facilitator superfamily (MFS) profile domain-containing protein n=1 Tax=Octactis speculum TaxID=3111310 RepID=A0A7S2CRT7_9STRA|mmetsp:Transcript_39252/g.53225  ORF Transcript_39252/g.53225 Transcript_39252/m.53225 type:complete len:518 (+) Transcript_39252:8-1561(+)
MTTDEPRLYFARWTMLTILSLLACVSDWVCFSVAPIPKAFGEAFPGMHPSFLVSIFLSTNVLFCFIEPLMVLRYGLRKVVVGGAWLMFIGCILRSGIPGMMSSNRVLLVLGTIFVGAGQPFFQCTPAMLAAKWFGQNERTLATTIAINANQIGIAVSYMAGAYLVHSAVALHTYLCLITAVSCILLVVTVAFFKESPPTPPSYSGMLEAAKEVEAQAQIQISSGDKAKDGWVEMQTLIKLMRRLLLENGFCHALVAFAVSIGITNVVSTFLDHLLEHLGFHQHTIGITGALFQVMIMAGSVVLGSIVDRTKLYYKATLFCFGMSFIWLLATSEKRLHASLFVISILFLGFFVGPIQPITAEIAVEVTYPADENAIVAVQQVFGNLFSAFLVPICNTVRSVHLYELGARGLTRKVRMDYLLLLVLCGLGGGYFSTFRAPLKRLLAETDSKHGRLPMKLDLAVVSPTAERASATSSSTSALTSSPDSLHPTEESNQRHSRGDKAMGAARTFVTRMRERT